MAAEESLSPSAQLCLSCGLCCSGALFPHAYFIFGENLSHWQSKGFDLVEEDGGVFFELGCPHLDGAACTIYDKPRPHTCGGFRCKPLQALEDDEIELEQALEKVGEAVELSKSLRSKLRRSGLKIKARNYHALRERLEQLQKEPDDASRISATAALTQLDAFDDYAEKHIMPDYVLED